MNNGSSVLLSFLSTHHACSLPAFQDVVTSLPDWNLSSIHDVGTLTSRKCLLYRENYLSGENKQLNSHPQAPHCNNLLAFLLELEECSWQ